MGCSNPKSKLKNESVITDRLKSSIDSGNTKAIKSSSEPYLKLYKVNDDFLQIQGINLNLLGYALWVGQVKSFIYIHKVLNADFKSMECFFQVHEISSFHIICAKGYTEILEYYLPFYLEETVEYPEIQDVPSRFSSVLIEESIWSADSKVIYQPIHLAVIQERVQVLTFVHKYFENRTFIPKCLDLEYRDEPNGESSALIACRHGKYKMIMFLHKTCKLNFRAKNRYGMNALNILIEGGKGKIDKNYFLCLKYLVEKILIDVEHNYKFNLLNTEDCEIVSYLETKLKEIGVNVTKADLVEGKVPNDEGNTETNLKSAEKSSFIPLEVNDRYISDKDTYR